MEPFKAILLITFLCFGFSEAKIYKKCDLAKELNTKHGYSRSMLPSWICMMEAESGLDTKKVRPYPPIVGSEKPPYKSYGIFQINSKNYCGMGYVGGKCKVRCEDLLKDDITKSAQCAQIVLNTEGFKAWKGWEKSCKKDPGNLPPLSQCFRMAAEEEEEVEEDEEETLSSSETFLADFIEE